MITSTSKAGYLQTIGSIPTKTEQQVIINQHKQKEKEELSMSAIKISMVILAAFMILAMILS